MIILHTVYSLVSRKQAPCTADVSGQIHSKLIEKGCALATSERVLDMKRRSLGVKLPRICSWDFLLLNIVRGVDVDGWFEAGIDLAVFLEIVNLLDGIRLGQGRGDEKFLADV